MSTPSHPKVIIIGGGLSGLTLAQALRKQGISFKIYERDNDDHSRVQGWSITLSVSLAGLTADLPDDMPPISTVSISKNLDLVGLDFSIFDGLTGEKFPAKGFLPPTHIKDAPPNSPLRANRRWFRQWLTHNIDVQWNKKFSSYLEDDTGLTVYFSDGSMERCDILVGADGAKSHVRAQLLGQQVGSAWTLPYANIIGEASLDEAATKRLWSLSRGIYLAKTGDATLFVSYRSVEADLKSSEWYYNLHFEDRSVVEKHNWLKKASKQEMYDKAVQFASPMQPELREIIELAGVEGIVKPPSLFTEFYPPYGLPAGRVTLMGDALHTMTPFRGLGANTACMDALELSKTITRSIKNNDNKTDIVEELKPYVDKAAKRGKAMVSASHEIGLHISAKDHSELFVKAMGLAVGGTPVR